jgi:hypothetical protein
MKMHGSFHGLQFAGISDRDGPPVSARFKSLKSSLNLKAIGDRRGPEGWGEVKSLCGPWSRTSGALIQRFFFSHPEFSAIKRNSKQSKAESDQRPARGAVVDSAIYFPCGQARGAVKSLVAFDRDRPARANGSS